MKHITKDFPNGKRRKTLCGKKLKNGLEMFQDVDRNQLYCYECYEIYNREIHDKYR